MSLNSCRDRLPLEVAKRRTFAIISHPDAGKTTLTEKLLLYGGAIHLAGSVKGRRGQRHATSDWMELEQERGISVTSSVMQFEYEGHVVNLLDTPGHEDFSEDTYRTEYQRSKFQLDDDEGTLTSTRESYEGGAIVVKSITRKWGVGAEGNVSSSTFEYTQLVLRAAPAAARSDGTCRACGCRGQASARPGARAPPRWSGCRTP